MSKTASPPVAGVDMETDVQFEVWQDGGMVASADSLSDAQHYMAIYGQDGPVEAVTAITTRFPGFNVIRALASPVSGDGSLQAEDRPSVPTCDVLTTIADLQALLSPETRTTKYSGGSFLELVPHVECADGFKMSVQASRTHYCRPREDQGRWYLVEVGYPSERVEAFMPYIDGEDSDPTGTVYGYVPIEVVAQVIADHGGFKATTANSPGMETLQASECTKHGEGDQ